MPRLALTLINFALFYVGWFGLVSGAAHGFGAWAPLLLVALLGVQFVFDRSLLAEGRLLAFAAAVGFVLDGALAAAGIVAYARGPLPAPLAPLWILALWVLFAACLTRSLSWLRGRPLLAAAFGAVGGPISYLIGMRLGAIEMGGAVSFLLLGLAWALALPALVAATPRLVPAPARSGRTADPRRRATLLLLPLALFALPSASEADEALTVVESVDLERYTGLWYEIASLPNSFQKRCVATTATYELREDGRLGVLNACRKNGLDSPVETTEGVARVVDESTSAKLKVRFFWPLNVSYWIIDLCPDYSWAVVAHPSRRYMWVIAREPTLDGSLYDAILDRARAQGIDTSKLRRTLQPPS